MAAQQPHHPPVPLGRRPFPYAVPSAPAPAPTAPTHGLEWAREHFHPFRASQDLASNYTATPAPTPAAARPSSGVLARAPALLRTHTPPASQRVPSPAAPASHAGGGLLHLPPSTATPITTPLRPAPPQTLASEPRTDQLPPTLRPPLSSQAPSSARPKASSPAPSGSAPAPSTDAITSPATDPAVTARLAALERALAAERARAEKLARENARLRESGEKKADSAITSFYEQELAQVRAELAALRQAELKPEPRKDTWSDSHLDAFAPKRPPSDIETDRPSKKARIEAPDAEMPDAALVPGTSLTAIRSNGMSAAAPVALISVTDAVLGNTCPDVTECLRCTLSSGTGDELEWAPLLAVWADAFVTTRNTAFVALLRSWLALAPPLAPLITRKPYSALRALLDSTFESSRDVLSVLAMLPEVHAALVSLSKLNDVITWCTRAAPDALVFALELCARFLEDDAALADLVCPFAVSTLEPVHEISKESFLAPLAAVKLLLLAPPSEATVPARLVLTLHSASRHPEVPAAHALLVAGMHLLLALPPAPLPLAVRHPFRALLLNLRATTLGADSQLQHVEARYHDGAEVAATDSLFSQALDT